MNLLTKEKIKDKLKELSEDEYKLFSQKLNPDVDNILGVRIPKLRKLAKELSNSNWKYYLDTIDNQYFEEIMLKGFIIGYAKEDFNTIKPFITNFIPLINNWSICDSFVSTLKIIDRNKSEVFKFINPYFYSKETFEIRFAIVVSLQYYLEEKYLDDLLKIYKEINSEEYYVEMALAWALSYLYMKWPDKIYNYIKETDFSKSVKNKTVQKIRDSYKVTDEYKNKALGLKL